MPTIEALALVTNQGKARIADMLVTGKSFVVDSFVVGSNGHDPIDPSFALTPDPDRTGCYCGALGAAVEAITTAGGCAYEGTVASTSFASPTCPVFHIEIPPGFATGAVSSLCLLGRIVYPTTDPEFGTTFLFAVANFPLKFKAAGDRFVYDVFIQL